MNTKLPKAIQAQVDNANRIVDDMNAKPDAVAPDVVQDAPAPPEVTAAVQPVQAAPVAPQDAPAPKVEDWEHKYRVLQGMFKAEVSRQVDTATRELKAQIEQVRAQAAAPQAPQTVPDKSYSFVKAEEVEDYGADLLDAAARTAKEQYLPLIESLQAKLASLEGSVNRGSQRMATVEQATVVSARDRFFSQLDTLQPTWETLNNDEGFLSWLDSADDLTGDTRRELFNKAHTALDSSRVAKFFAVYGAANGMASQAATPAAPANTMKPSVPMENLQAPGKPRNAAPDAAKKTISRNEIAAFYDRQRRGAYRGKEADAARFEMEIFAAQAEGRIT